MSEFSIGDRVELVYTSDNFTKLLPGDRGTVTGTDDTGAVLVRWDTGSHLSMVPAFGDRIRKVSN
jgi:hypothetical protein